MNFSELNPRFIQLTRTPEPCEKWSWHPVSSLEEADGVMFLCPFHFKENKVLVGIHSIICWFQAREIPAQLLPGPGRWTASGSLEKLTLSPSVNTGKDDWHGYITEGKVIFC